MIIYNPVNSFGETKNSKKTNKIKGKAILVSNHIGYLDAFMFIRRYYPRNPYTLALHEVFTNTGKFINFWMKRAHVLDVTKNGIKKLINILYSGNVVALTSEGHIGTGEKINDISNGAAYLAIKTHTNIYPTITLTPYKTFRRQYVIYGDMIDCSKYFKKDFEVDKEDVIKLSNELKNKMDDLLILGRSKIKK